jgi:ATP-dependent Clp protease ATP-binding subunit ClpA
VHMKDGQPVFEVTPAPPKASKPRPPKKKAAKDKAGKAE